MKSYSTLIIIALLNFLTSFNQTVHAQCGQQITVTDINTNEKIQKGSFKLSIRSDSDYHGELVRIDGTYEQSVASFDKGNGTQHRFSDLDISSDVFYRVVLAFKNEDRFLCKRKVVDVEFTNLR